MDGLKLLKNRVLFMILYLDGEIYNEIIKRKISNNKLIVIYYLHNLLFL